jgi:translocation and assembly module TamB
MRRLIPLCLAFLPFAAMAQDDRGYLTALLEDNLSGIGRQVTITGFEGALSSRATMEQLTIADETGVWLTLNGVVFNWERSALLSGEINVDELSAQEIIIARMPDAGEDTPSPEAQGFALPELPVSVQIGRIAADRIELRADVLGSSVIGKLAASASLANGEGIATLLLERTDDGPDGRISLNGSYSNATRQLMLDLEAIEGAGGIASNLLNLPGQPAVALTVKGDGLIDDYAADVRLATDGSDRLAGTVTLRGTEDGGSDFDVDFAGDLAPLFLPQYAAFFGPEITLAANGARSATGALRLDQFTLGARAVRLNGALALAPDGLPEKFNLTGDIAMPDGSAVLLPTAGPDETRLTSARLALSYDAAEGQGWRGTVHVIGLDQLAFNAERLTLTGSGRIARQGIGNAFGATLAFDATGLLPADAALAQAVGDAVQGEVVLWWQQGTPGLRIPRLTVQGSDYALKAAGKMDGLEQAFRLTGRAEASLRDIARLSGLAGRDLGGSADLTLTGSGSPLGGEFNVTATVMGQNLTADQAELDRLLSGTSEITLAATRGTEGTRLDSLTLRAGTLTASASGTLATDASDLTATVDFVDLSALGGQYRGALTGQAHLTGALDNARITLDATTTDLGIGQPQADRMLGGTSTLTLDMGVRDGAVTLTTARVTNPQLTATATGTIDAANSDVTVDLTSADMSVLGGGYGGTLRGQAKLTGTMTDARVTADVTADNLSIGQPQADRLLRGTSTLAASVSINDGAVQIETARLANPQLTAAVTGQVTGTTRTIDLDAKLSDMGLIVPDFPGPLTITGTATDDGAGYVVDLRGQGPGQIDARVTGRVSANGADADLSIGGTAQAGLANPFLSGRIISGPIRFDLGLNGPLALSSLSGTASLSGGALSDPNLAFSFTDISATANLGGNRAVIQATNRVSSGGQIAISGSVGLTAPFSADLTADLSNVTLRDPDLYETTADGRLTITGPMTGGGQIAGRVALSETEIRIPSTGLGGVADVEGLIHRREPADVRATRARAGLLGNDDGRGGSGGAGAFGLDLAITAPNRVFIRGRGLDAELGGQLTLRGTTANIIPAGSFSLIRGRLDILGKRLDLTEATLLLTGDFIPTVGIAASTESDGIVSTIRIDGPANDPAVTFSSSPDLPEEEVLARLLFGRGLQNLSALQAAQLASAVATLAGRGGEGIIGRLRAGFGLDDLDVQTSDEGGTSVTAGKYLSENLYTEFTVDQQGQSQINLNLDVTKSITLRGRVGSDGDTGIGVYLEKDY